MGLVFPDVIVVFIFTLERITIAGF